MDDEYANAFESESGLAINVWTTTILVMMMMMMVVMMMITLKMFFTCKNPLFIRDYDVDCGEWI